jgi:hypothetical protein
VDFYARAVEVLLGKVYLVLRVEDGFSSFSLFVLGFEQRLWLFCMSFGAFQFSLAGPSFVKFLLRVGIKKSLQMSF